MIALVNTNVLLDVLMRREPHWTQPVLTGIRAVNQLGKSTSGMLALRTKKASVEIEIANKQSVKICI